MTQSLETIHPAQEQPMRAGLAFTPAFRMLITGRAYIVPIMVKTDAVLHPMIDALNLTADVAWSMEHMNRSYPTVDLLKRTLDGFHGEFSKLFKEAKAFLTSVSGRAPHSRYRRGAANFIGSLANLLFGTATQEQVDKIHKNLDNLNQLTESERQTLNIHSEILNITIRDLRHINSAISRLETAAETAADIIRRFSIKTLEIEGDVRLIETISLIQLALSDLDHDFTNLKIGFMEMLQTYISPLIIPDDVLLDILKKASPRLPGLLFPAEPECLSLYQDISTVYTRRTAFKGSLCYYLVIPMKGDPSDLFDVFEIHAFPSQIPSIDPKYFVQITPDARYLAVSEDRNMYMLVQDFERCRRHDALLICPPRGPIYTTDESVCEISIFLGTPDAAALCPKQLVERFRPTFHRIPAGWAFNVDQPTTLTMVCPSSSLQKFRQTIQGTGILQIGPSCAVHADTFTLPALDEVVDDAPLSVHPSPLPLAPLLAGWEKRVLTQLPNASLPPMGAFHPTELSVLAPRLLPIHRVEAPPTESQYAAWWVWVLVGAGLPTGMALMVGVWWTVRRFAAVPSSDTSLDVHSSWLNMVARPYRAGTARRPSMTQGRVILKGKVCRSRETIEEVDEEQCEQEPAEQREQ
ncbi:hypothetical protein GWK47_044479 [Chionoecetes opilio]|uniref:Envelope protein n=1 Tax=Chionoecetes opilio TaxID=41210 RepID=A0A8J4Y897_CHIOP|nr:hypothetical protein GWK47_044479 [Chionoecetes opilio]